MLDEHTKAASLAYLQQEGLDEYDHARFLFQLMGITSLQEARQQAIPMSLKELQIIFSRKCTALALAATAPEPSSTLSVMGF